MQFRKLAFALPAVLALFGLAGQAHAGNLNLTATFDSSVTSLSDGGASFEAAVNAAISQTLMYVDTSTAVNESILFSATPGQGLGGSAAFDETISYSTYYSFLQNRITSGSATALEITAFNSMPAPDASGGTGISTLIDGGGTADASTMRIVPGLANAINQSAVVPPAQLNAFGGAIGNILINTDLTNNNRANTPTDEQYDTQAVVQHEIDELLGTGGQGTTLTATGTDNRVGILDLFRYSSAGIRSYTNSGSASSYFSINGGTTNLDPFNQAGDGGADYADWGDVTTPQVQDAFGQPGVAGELNLGAAELESFDAAGYQLTAAGKSLVLGGAAAPEPSSLLLLLPGAVTLGGMVIRRRKGAVKGA